MAEDGSANWVISFGPFRVDRARRLLERHGEHLHLGSRAFDILSHLLEHAGQVVSHRELITAAWPTSHVEDSNLRFQLTNLRKALDHDGKTYIVNVPGRGYCFTAHTIRAENVGQRVPRRPNNPVKGLAPLPKSKLLVGRSDVTARISDLISRQRMITIVGPGGIGKTSVAIAAAQRAAETEFADVCFFELGLVQDAFRVTDALAVALGLPAQGADSLIDIVALLKTRRILIVVDCCEHVIDAIASLLEQVIVKASTVHILATSREALRIEYEQVFQLEPLVSPPLNQDLSEVELLSYSAAKLLVELVGSAQGAGPSKLQSQLIANICSKLDGSPLAIELAASQGQVLGLHTLTGLLEGPLALAWPGRRGAPEKHRTIGAMLDWSYRLLSDEDKHVFRLISVFAGPFSLETAHGLVERNSPEVAAALAALVAKSLLTVRHTKAGTRYSLLDLTKSYARSKLSEVGEQETMYRRHARHYEQTMRAFLADGQDRTLALNALGEQIEDIRSAITWAFSPKGDSSLAIALATLAIPVWSHLHLYHEWQDNLAEAVMIANQLGVDGATELNLHFGFANALAFTRWASQDYKNAWTKVYSLAVREEQIDHQLYALFLLHVTDAVNSNMREALEDAEKLDQIVKSNAAITWNAIADFALGNAKRLMGRLEEAHEHLHRASTYEKRLPSIAEPAVLRPGSRLFFDSRMTPLLAASILSHNLLLRGCALEAVETADRALAIAESEKLLSAKAIILEWAAVDSLLIGRLDRAQEAATALVKLWEEVPLPYYNAVVAPALAALVNAWSGDRRSLERLDGLIVALGHGARIQVRYFSTEKLRLLIHLKERGEYEPALEPLSTEDSNAELWCIPEMIRLNGRLALLNGRVEAAEVQFTKSLHVAQDQGSRFWELRTANDLASLWITQNKSDEAQKLLGGILPKLSPGLETEDLKRARALLITHY